MPLAMGDNIAGRLLDDAQQWVSDKVDWLFDPIYGWIFLLVIFILFLGIINWFAPFDWLKKLTGFLVLLAVAFTAGGWKMGKHYKERLAEERAKRKAAEARQQNNRDQSNNQGNGWWW